MSQILVRVVSNVAADPFQDAQQAKRGDVIAAFDQDHQWGAMELALPQYRILHVPDLPMAEVEPLLSPEVALSPAPDPMLQFRGFYLDLDMPGLPAGLVDYLADDARQSAIFTLADTDVFTGMRRQRASLPNPNVIG